MNGLKATGHVPWRKDDHASLSADLEKGVWYDLARKEGGGIKEFKARLGLNGAGSQQTQKVVASYNYQDEQGTLLYQVLRFEPKGFAQRRPDANDGWTWKLNGVRRVPYRLPQLLMASTLYVVEGEKDADRLWSLGIPATTCPEGAGKWREEYSEHFASKRAVILPDNDEPGERHALQVARARLLVAAAVKTVRLPGLPPKSDVSNWLNTGHTREELAELVKVAPILRAEELASSQEQVNRGTDGKRQSSSDSWPVLDDELWKKEPVKEKGRVVDYQDVMVDVGEGDKRLLIVESEFASALTVMARDGNILSAVMRQAWDDGNLSPLTRNNPIKATKVHINSVEVSPRLCRGSMSLRPGR